MFKVGDKVRYIGAAKTPQEISDVLSIPPEEVIVIPNGIYTVDYSYGHFTLTEDPMHRCYDPRDFELITPPHQKFPILSRVRFHSTASAELDGKIGTILGISADFPLTTFYIVLLDECVPSRPDYYAITMIESCLERIYDVTVKDVWYVT